MSIKHYRKRGDTWISQWKWRTGLGDVARGQLKKKKKKERNHLAATRIKWGSLSHDLVARYSSSYLTTFFIFYIWQALQLAIYGMVRDWRRVNLGGRFCHLRRSVSLIIERAIAGIGSAGIFSSWLISIAISVLLSSGAVFAGINAEVWGILEQMKL